VPIGLPIANTTVHVLDEARRPAPPGVPGELCIGGVGVALGYRGDENLTAERFRTDPARGRYYLTGDLVRHRHDGQLEFLGRVDRQVKIRGHRIELGEVEAVLEEHPAVAAVAVLVEPANDGLPTLTAAVVGCGDPDTRLPERLHAHAAARLPAAAVPARFVPIQELPLTDNGKIDHRELSAMLASSDGPAAALPADSTTRTLVQLWREVLGSQRLSAESNFFLSGGHSLLATRLAERVSARLGTTIGFDAVFAAPTPASLAVLLTGREEAT
jgi:acyl-coenzyme A synthetase/AMP-(fatty) acid ligase